MLGIICFPRDEKVSIKRQRGKTVRRGETQISEECAEFGLKAFFFSPIRCLIQQRGRCARGINKLFLHSLAFVLPVATHCSLRVVKQNTRNRRIHKLKHERFL